MGLGLLRRHCRQRNRRSSCWNGSLVSPREFRNRRRLEVYRASLESVAADGLITERERRILETMRTKLGISTEDANRIETEVLQRGAKSSAAGGPAPTSA